jgi:transcriptional regulator with XRE-family HTH domain
MTLSFREEAQHKFGQALRRERGKAGLSQEKLAARAGLDRSYVGSVERGERNVSLVNIVKLAYALDIPTADLFDDLTTK